MSTITKSAFNVRKMAIRKYTVGVLERVKRIIPLPIRSILRLLCDKRSFVYLEGYLKSLVALSPVGKDNAPLPWFTYSAISFLQERLNPDLEVFEYGCGNSTLYFQSKVKTITSVEHDDRWRELIRPKINSAKVFLLSISIDESNNEYVDSIMKSGTKYDIVIVDGRRRVQCFEKALGAIKDDGIIIVDDADRPEYSAIFAMGETADLSYLRFRGLRPSSCFFDSTVIFYKRNRNCLGI
jgi:hypothetical protein